MGFPNVIYGDYGDEKVAQSTAIGSNPLGQSMILPDGRKFRHARSSTAQAMSAGFLYQHAVDVNAGTSAEKILECTAAVGATSVSVNSPAGTAVTTDRYAEGFLAVASSTGSGIGHQYKIKSNGSAAAGSAAFTVVLYPEDAIAEAIGGTTATVGLLEGEFTSVGLVTADSALLGPFLGIPPVAVSAGFYHWVQRHGPALAFVAGTAIAIGDPVFCSTAVVGAVAAISATTLTDAKARNGVIGYGMSVSLTNGFSQVDLSLE